MPTFTDYRIAAGHNNAAGLTKLGKITPSGDIPFTEPTAKLNYSPGTARLRLDAGIYAAGFKSQEWTLGFVTLKQYDYLKTTYCAGGYSGLVTVRTRWNSGSYANYNATLQLPTEAQLEQFRGGNKWVNVPVKLMNLVAI